MMKFKLRAVGGALVSCLVLSSCGDKAPEEQQDGRTFTSSGARSQGIAPDASPSEPIPSIDCQALKPPQGSQSESMLGLTFGMSVEEAKQRLSCFRPGFRFSEQSMKRFSAPDIPNGAVSGLVAEYYSSNRGPNQGPGTSRTGAVKDDVTLLFTNVGGASKLIKVDRMVRYEGDQRPMWDTFRSEVEQKYAGLTFEDRGSGNQTGILVQLPDGQKLTKSNRLFSTCIGSGAWHHINTVNPLCGLSVGFAVQVDRDGSGYVNFVQSTLTKPGYAFATMKEAGVANAPIIEAERKRAQEAAPKPEL